MPDKNNEMSNSCSSELGSCCAGCISCIPAMIVYCFRSIFDRKRLQKEEKIAHDIEWAKTEPARNWALSAIDYDDFFIALRMGDYQTLNRLVHEIPSIVDEPESKLGNTGDTPLMLAVKHRNYYLIQFLLDHGADPRAKNYEWVDAFDVIASDDSESRRILEVWEITHKKQKSP